MAATLLAKDPHPAVAVLNPSADFWLMGGASILLWMFMVLGQVGRSHSEAIESHFMQVGAIFSIFSIFCNHPHFMISYRFGYGNGSKFILSHWFCLLFVPLGMFAFYILAYVKFDTQIYDLPWVIFSNRIFDQCGLEFRLGTLANLGTEILSLSVLLMNITVGWHYSKQVFGCIMVYARYQNYSISQLQRHLLKASLFSVAFFNFFYIAIYAPEYNANSLSKAYFFNIPLITLGLPKFLIPLSAASVVILGAAVLYFVFFENYRKLQRRPPVNLILPWIAFHIWWIPFVRQNEYYFLAIPFFHSLQYLPFAFRRVNSQIKPEGWHQVKSVLRATGLLLIGFCAFELVPSLLDRKLDTPWYTKTWFFMVAFAVFINVHHFFIDSVVWKLDQREVREALL